MRQTGHFVRVATAALRVNTSKPPVQRKAEGAFLSKRNSTQRASRVWTASWCFQTTTSRSRDEYIASDTLWQQCAPSHEGVVVRGLDLEAIAVLHLRPDQVD
jgi:hypothetical protein